MTEVTEKGREFKHATYVTDQWHDHDMLVVKQNIHYSDGSVKPDVITIKDFPKYFYVTKEGFQNHTDKKEWEDINKLMVFKTTQAHLCRDVAKAIGKPGVKQPLRMLARSPYLYGADILPQSLLKKKYLDRWPDCVSPISTVAVLDIEADVVWGTGEILCVTLSFKDRIILSVNRKFLGTIVDPLPKIHKLFDKYLGKYKEERKIDLEVVICDTPTQCCQVVFDRAHDWRPDFITIWNMSYDLPYIQKTVEASGIMMADLVSDPVVPPEYRHYRFNMGSPEKTAASGRKMLLSPAERWHTVEATSSFYFVDAMCLYKRIRIQAGNESSYSLDNILKVEELAGKLKFDEVKETGLAWHQRMQSEYKLEYLIYNVFDCISIELLDEKTNDISQAFGVLSGISDFSRFKSNPGKISDDLHFFCLQRGKVIGTMSDTIVSDLDDHILGMTGWISTLPSYMLDDHSGIKAIAELPEIHSNLRGHTADLDIEGTYPNIEDVCNISKETTYRELSKIRGVSEQQQRAAGVNLTGGSVNAIEICTSVIHLPTPDELLEGYIRSLNKAA